MRSTLQSFAFLGFVLVANVSAKEKNELLPEAKNVEAIQVECNLPGSNDVKFKATKEDWKSIRAGLLPAKVDQNPSKWEWLGEVDVVADDGRVYHIELYETGKAPGAFAIGEKPAKRVYYRGGDTKKLIAALKKAYENSRK